ncbi:hypothetical protein PsorP6_008570 [Peronosclerospora sorghi]|uniref:Uncharacterized protein n=1 Tax=Peronosclerospora sorghi TaxID=230839 RepID=A0ACC0W9P0_9STRA|nr:hypothetical protein PsorP6_008570 [Peronosclerospora sorghi]
MISLKTFYAKYLTSAAAYAQCGLPNIFRPSNSKVLVTCKGSANVEQERRIGERKTLETTWWKKHRPKPRNARACVRISIKVVVNVAQPFFSVMWWLPHMVMTRISRQGRKAQVPFE